MHKSKKFQVSFVLSHMLTVGQRFLFCIIVSSQAQNIIMYNIPVSPEDCYLDAIGGWMGGVLLVPMYPRATYVYCQELKVIVGSPKSDKSMERARQNAFQVLSLILFLSIL